MGGLRRSFGTVGTPVSRFGRCLGGDVHRLVTPRHLAAEQVRYITGECAFPAPPSDRQNTRPTSLELARAGTGCHPCTRGYQPSGTIIVA